MKKLFLVSIVAAVLAAAFVSASFAAGMTSIGYIEVQKVFKGYSATASAQSELSKEEAAFKKEFDASQKKLEDAKTAKKSGKEIEALTKELEEGLAPKREKLMKMNEELTSKLQTEIVTAVKTVAKNLGLDVILDKQVVITGGVDISDMVINKLNEKK